MLQYVNLIFKVTGNYFMLVSLFYRSVLVQLPRRIDSTQNMEWKFLMFEKCVMPDGNNNQTVWMKN